MKIFNYYQIIFQQPNGSFEDTKIFFTKEEDAKQAVINLNKRYGNSSNHYQYKEISKKCFTSIEEYDAYVSLCNEKSR